MYLDELERLLQDVWTEEVVLGYTETYANQVRNTEGDSEDFQSELERLQNWINGRRIEIEMFIDTGGLIAENNELSCYSTFEGEDEGLNDIGNLATSVSHSCSSTSSASNQVVLLMIVLGLHSTLSRRRNKKSGKVNKYESV